MRLKPVVRLNNRLAFWAALRLIRSLGVLAGCANPTGLDQVFNDGTTGMFDDCHAYYSLKEAAFPTACTKSFKFEP